MVTVENLLLVVVGVYFIANIIVGMGSFYVGMVQDGDRPPPRVVFTMVLIFLLAGSLIALRIVCRRKTCGR